MAKTQRATDKLNVAISTVSSAGAILNTILETMPDSEAKRGLLVIEEQIEKAVSAAFDAMRDIKKAAEVI